MNIFANKGLIIRVSAIIANVMYILFWVFWLINGGFKFIGKIGILLFSPPLLLNLHWGTQWVTNKVSYALIILIVFLVTSFLVWKLDVKVFKK